ncbi:DNA repair protein RecN [candidate division WOR-3 bacterium]|nr:DNA repair protein RecN [candidate division WOR-3 bacterium]
MLKVLRVKNFALMKDLTIDFDKGLTVITGETGAGKSMIVEAIATLSGSRMEDVLIRSGKNFAEVTGIFEVRPSVMEKLVNSGIEVDSDLIVRRKIERNKRQNAYINDQIVSLNLLKELAQEMIDLIGQYENQALLYAKNHLSLLDSFTSLDDLKAEYNKNYGEYIQLQRRLEDLLETMRQKDEKIDYLKYQITEIEKVNLQPDEEEKLILEKELLLSTEKRSLLSTQIITNLYEADGSIIENLAKVKRLFDDLCKYDNNLNEMNERLEVSISSIDDIYREISSYQSQIEFSQQKIDDVLVRLDTINKIKKKYGKTLNEINNFLRSIKMELILIETRDEEVKKIRIRVAEIEQTITKQAEELSSQRRKAAVSLKKRILEILTQLGMKKADFEIRLTNKDIDENGKDDVEFYISTNPGEELKPLRKIASGGEISRITLSFKTLLSDIDRIPTIIFDEVDTGIGGRIAEAVGRLLAKVSEKHQIICITHLPQISVFADNHILVKKEIKGKETFTRVVKLDEEMKKLEIARMLGGQEITEKTMEHAAEYLQKGQHK